LNLIKNQSKMKKSILSIMIAALLGLGVVSCREQKGDAEEAADDVEQTMENADDATEEAEKVMEESTEEVMEEGAEETGGY
jgi:uncharacterized protein YgfB (UPF0149 family)